MDGWGQVAFWIAVAVFTLWSQRWGARRMLAAAESMDAREREDVAKALGGRWRLITPVVLAVLTAVSSAVVLQRGSPTGWGWAVAALLFGLATHQTLTIRGQAFARLGPPNPDEHERRRSTRTTAILAGGAACYVVSQVLVAVVPDETTGVIVAGALMLAAVVSLLAAAWSGVWVGKDEKVRR